MKAADTKVIKGIKKFLEDVVPKYEDLNFATADTLKSKDQERGSFHFNLTVKSDEFPDVFDKEDYLKSLKKKFEVQFGRKVRFFQIHWSYSKESCSMSFEVKLAQLS